MTPSIARLLRTRRNAVRYSVRDRFLADTAAPLVDGMAAQPGPGNRALVQNDGQFSTLNRQLVVPVQATPVDGDLRISWDAQTRTAGLAVFFGRFRLLTASASIRFGWGVAATGNPTQAMLRMNSLVLSGFQNGSTVGTFGGHNLNTDYEICVVVRDTGSYWLMRGGAGTTAYMPEWTLVWVDPVSTTTPLYPVISSLSMGALVENVRVPYDPLPAPWNVAYGIAVGRKAVTVNGDTLAHDSAGGIIEYTLTAATGVTQELKFRIQDASNYWVVRMDQAGSTMKLIEVVAGVETERSSSAQTWTNGTSYRIVVHMFRTNIRTFAGTTAAAPAAKNTYLTAATGLTASLASVSHAGTNFNSWPVHPSIPSRFSTPVKGFLTVGDSTAGGVDDTPPSGASAGYPRMLMDLLNTAGELAWMEAPSRFAHGGYTTAALRAVIDADIAAADTTVIPRVIFYQMGANDVADAPTMADEAGWKTNTAYIFDALHAAYPAAHIYVAILWTDRSPSNCLIINAWMATVIATRSAWCHWGIDEVAVLEAGDGGATYTADGTHPNAAGYARMAAAWKVAAGL